MNMRGNAATPILWTTFLFIETAELGGAGALVGVGVVLLLVEASRTVVENLMPPMQWLSLSQMKLYFFASVSLISSLPLS